jgi:CheY-like chemotaxis protein
MEKKAKILLVDDDTDFVQATSRVLKTRPYQIIIAYNGEEGMRKAREEKPDLILLDIMMPVKDGFVVADEINKDPILSKIPVLALTSFDQSLGQPFAFEVSEYLKKPIKPNDLIEKVSKHLKRLGFKE